MPSALRRTRPDGTLYTRTTAIDAQLDLLDKLSRDELLARCAIHRRDNPNYIPTECLLHFVRACRADNSNAQFERLYKVLLERVHRALPRQDAADGKTRSLTNERIREKVCDRIIELLVRDREAYEDRLDFFEIRFDMALKRLRQDAQKQAWRDEQRSQPIEYDEDSGELDPEVESAAANANPLEGLQSLGEAYRLRLDTAIEQLPEEQNRTIQMLLLGFQSHSDDPTVNTICKVLGKSPKTIWNYRERALKALRKALAEGDDQ